MGLLRSTLETIAAGHLNARIEFVFCNREKGQRAATDRFLEYVKRNRIPLETLSSYRFRRQREDAPWPQLREAYDEAVIKRLQQYSPAISIHAGYMLIAPVLCQHFLTINLHPALPDGPSGTWQSVIWELMEQRAPESGVMVHVSTTEVDAGPVLAYCRYPLTGGQLDRMWLRTRDRSMAEIREREGETNQLFKAIRENALRRERPMLAKTLIAIADGRIDPANPPVADPMDLTEVVAQSLDAAAS